MAARSDKLDTLKKSVLCILRFAVCLVLIRRKLRETLDYLKVCDEQAWRLFQL